MEGVVITADLATPGHPDLGDDVALLADATRAAGEVALGFFGHDPRTWSKAGDSPVTEADIAVDKMLQSRLMAARPDYGWLSEETIDTPDRLSAKRLFVVDPIDGTRAFIGKDPRWTVSVAIVEGDRPVAAALFQPAIDDLMLAAKGRGAWRGTTRLQVTERETLNGASLTGPRKFGALEAEATEAGIHLQAPVPSLALRIAHVANGTADAAYAFARAHDWDLAAADLLVWEAGGRLTDINGETLVYNRAVPRHAALVAAGPGVYHAFVALYGTILAKHHRARGS
jgi:myo-inositol-1(or 4)-monophosphatase